MREHELFLKRILTKCWNKNVDDSCKETIHNIQRLFIRKKHYIAEYSAVNPKGKEKGWVADSSYEKHGFVRFHYKNNVFKWRIADESSAQYHQHTVCSHDVPLHLILSIEEQEKHIQMLQSSLATSFKFMIISYQDSYFELVREFNTKKENNADKEELEYLIYKAHKTYFKCMDYAHKWYDMIYTKKNYSSNFDEHCKTIGIKLPDRYDIPFFND